MPQRIVPDTDTVEDLVVDEDFLCNPERAGEDGAPAAMYTADSEAEAEDETYAFEEQQGNFH